MVAPHLEYGAVIIGLYPNIYNWHNILIAPHEKMSNTWGETKIFGEGFSDSSLEDSDSVLEPSARGAGRVVGPLQSRPKAPSKPSAKPSSQKRECSFCREKLSNNKSVTCSGCKTEVCQTCYLRAMLDPTVRHHTTCREVFDLGTYLIGDFVLDNVAMPLLYNHFGKLHILRKRELFMEGAKKTLEWAFWWPVLPDTETRAAEFQKKT